MFSSSSSQIHTNMTCGLKVDTQSPGWYRTLDKVLRKIEGVSYSIDAEEGMAYITGRVDPNKLLRKIAKAGKHADLCWVETGNHSSSSLNPYGSSSYQHYHHPHQYHSQYPAAAGYHHPASYFPLPQRHHAYHGYGSYGYPTWA